MPKPLSDATRNLRVAKKNLTIFDPGVPFQADEFELSLDFSLGATEFLGDFAGLMA